MEMVGIEEQGRKDATTETLANYLLLKTLLKK